MKKRATLPRVEVIIEDTRWRGIPLDDIASEACGAALSETGKMTKGFEVAILASSDSRIKELNTRFRNQPKPTNVLAWPAPSTGGLLKKMDKSANWFLGDIALAWETCSEEATNSGLALSAHVAHLIVHGCLHLLGFSHATDIAAREMQEFEIIALASIGIKSPYDGVNVLQ